LLAYILTDFSKQFPMKRILLLSTVALLLSFVAAAQSLHFGVKAGTDLHKIDGQSFKDEFAFGYHAGVFAEINLTGKLNFQPEFYYSQVDVKTSSNFSDVYGINNITKVKLSYINIPVLFNIKPVPLLAFQLGPQFGIKVDKNKNLLENGKDAFKSGDVGLVGGVQLSFSKLKVYGRYVRGLNDISNTTGGKWNNQTIHLGIGIRLF
jgi:hypothetical protein